MTDEPLFCRLNVTSDAIRVSGLQNKWPKRVVRYLAPLDFSQQADQMLQDLFVTFDQMPRGRGALELGVARYSRPC
jgi:hypothetical protein